MPRKSSITTLPEDLRKRLDFLLAENVLTLDQITEWLDDAGHPRSRSSIGRRKKKIDVAAARLRESRQITEALTKELGDAAAQGKQGRLLVEMARSLVFNFLMKQDPDGDDIDAKDVAMLGKGLAEMGRALRYDQDFETKLRETIAQEEREKAAKVAEEAVSSQGLDAEKAAFIRGQILGVKVDGNDG